VGIQQADAIRAEQAQAVLPGEAQAFIFQLRAFWSCFAETPRCDDRRPDAPPGALQ
jgi:hypothetical protein